jgi:hypothetical protein
MLNSPFLKSKLKLVQFWLLVVTCLSVFSSICNAQPSSAPPVRLRGELLQVNAQQLVLKDREGKTLSIDIGETVPVSEAYPVAVEAIQPNSYIGTAAMPGTDGTLNALEVLVFPEAARGTGEGHYPWDLQPGSTMTNATVSQLVPSSTSYEMRLQYKGGEKSVVIPKGAPIVSIRPASRALLVPGAQVVIVANKDADRWVAIRVTAGKDGFKPPM